jgi:hypothetical protein
MSRLHVQVNAGDARIATAGGSIGDLDVQVNAGKARVSLGGQATGELRVNAGEIDLCVPPDAALTIEVDDQFLLGTNLDERGLVRQDDTWTREGSGGPAIRLSVQGNAASFELDPEGGC